MGAEFVVMTQSMSLPRRLKEVLASRQSAEDKLLEVEKLAGETASSSLVEREPPAGQSGPVESAKNEIVSPTTALASDPPLRLGAREAEATKTEPETPKGWLHLPRCAGLRVALDDTRADV